MKFSGRNIQHRLYGLRQIGDKLSRARFFRGHSVHSPFVYGMVRKVFMKNIIPDDADMEFICALENIGISRKRAIQIHNTMRYCDLRSWSIDSCDAGFCVFTPTISNEATVEAYNRCRDEERVFIAVLPYSSSARCTLFHSMIEGHNGTAIDNRGFIVFMNNDLPKQHFKL